METSPAETTIPVNEGAATVALAFKDPSNQELLIRPPMNKLLVKETSDVTNNLLFMETSPLTNNLLLKETSDETDNRLFIETSPAEIIKPVNEGAATVALAFKDVSNNVLTILPPTNKLLVKETSDVTNNLLFMETSLEK
jgi:hypothetical protein